MHKCRFACTAGAEQKKACFRRLKKSVYCFHIATQNGSLDSFLSYLGFAVKYINLRAFKEQVWFNPQNPCPHFICRVPAKFDSRLPMHLRNLIHTRLNPSRTSFSKKPNSRNGLLNILRVEGGVKGGQALQSHLLFWWLMKIQAWSDARSGPVSNFHFCVLPANSAQNSPLTKSERKCNRWCIW